MFHSLQETERLWRGVRFRLTRRLRDRDLRELWPGIERVAVRLRPYAAAFGNLKPHELTLLCAVALHHPQQHRPELGSGPGPAPARPRLRVVASNAFAGSR